MRETVSIFLLPMPFSTHLLKMALERKESHLKQLQEEKEELLVRCGELQSELLSLHRTNEEAQQTRSLALEERSKASSSSPLLSTPPQPFPLLPNPLSGDKGACVPMEMVKGERGGIFAYCVDQLCGNRVTVGLVYAQRSVTMATMDSGSHC